MAGRVLLDSLLLRPPLIPQALSSLPTNKAAGPDNIPAEAIRAALDFFAPFFHQTISMIWSEVSVPVAWRGGRIATLFKKGDSTIKDNYRGLLISDHLSKAFTSIIDDNVNAPYINNISAEQCGGFPNRGTDLATHVIRTSLDIAARDNLSIAVLFIDLTKAFDLVVREFALGWPTYSFDSKRGLLIRLGIPDEHADEAVRSIDSDGPLLAQAGVDYHSIDLLNSLHSNSWFEFGILTNI